MILAAAAAALIAMSPGVALHLPLPPVTGSPLCTQASAHCYVPSPRYPTDNPVWNAAWCMGFNAAAGESADRVAFFLKPSPKDAIPLTPDFAAKITDLFQVERATTKVVDQDGNLIADCSEVK